MSDAGREAERALERLRDAIDLAFTPSAPVDCVAEQRRCRRCGVVYFGDEVAAFFRSRGTNDRWSSANLRAVCIGCELTARAEAKEHNRYREKARRTRDHHADRYVRQGLVSSRSDFVDRYGWDLDQMAHDIEHASGNGCPYCHQPFADMAHGLRDITLDIVDPDRPPHYQTNTRWVCGTCNSEKQRTSPWLWGAKLAAWRRWRRRPEWPDGTLFGGWPA